MSFLRTPIIAVAIALSSLVAHAATVVPVTQDGNWYAFNIGAEDTPDGNLNWHDGSYTGSYAGDAGALSFTFTVADKAILRVVDTGFAGDVFYVSLNGHAPMLSSGASLPFVDQATAPIVAPDAYADAWADTAFSRGEWLLSAGSYTVTGSLAKSVIDLSNLTPLNSTSGGLSVTAVPEPTSMAMAVVGVLVLLMRRRTRA